MLFALALCSFNDNIFVSMNISIAETQKIAGFFEVLSVPSRLGILLAIGEKEVCVCHLEAVLELRQAVISQHLQVLKRNDWVLPRRQGRFVYYRLKNPQVLTMIYEVARMNGVSQEQIEAFTRVPVPGCSCSLCSSSSNC